MNRTLVPAFLLTAGASEALRLSGWMATLRLDHTSTAPPAELAALVRDVEREPELIPGVHAVRVFERGESSVRYEVTGARFGVGWRVRFRKEWDGDHEFRWRSEGGTGMPEQEGILRLIPPPTTWVPAAGTHLQLTARTRSALPLLGGAATLLIDPLFLQPTFAAWLENLARTAEANR